MAPLGWEQPTTPRTSTPSSTNASLSPRSPATKVTSTPCSRASLAWRMAKDGGFPFAKFHSHVSKRFGTPLRAMFAVLFANAAAISGTQLYHTASIIMLQNRPTEVTLSPEQKLRGVLWHARQICAISISNHHHGAWTNSIQPLWIAGQCMSHPDEHRAILEILDKIEKASGWGTRWRANDLREFWGDLGE